MVEPISVTAPPVVFAILASNLVKQSKRLYSTVKKSGTPEQMEILLDQCLEAVDLMIEHMPRETWPTNPNLK